MTRCTSTSEATAHTEMKSKVDSTGLSVSTATPQSEGGFMKKQTQVLGSDQD